jgi:UDP-N-acetyl-D-glucosamine dehydrogenase
METLREKISGRQASVGVMGLGYVGLPLALEFARKGFSVTGFEINPKLARDLSKGVSHIPDVPSGDLGAVVDAGRFRATRDFDGLRRCDAIIVCVPTPLRKTKEPDVSLIQKACESIARRLRRGQLVILESTTYPGTTREMVLPMFEARGLRLGRDFLLAFSPERVDPANKDYGIPNTPKVVGGVSRESTELAALLYGQIVERVVEVSSADAAEMAKLLENTFRAINIGLANEFALMSHRLGLDVWEIIAAASTKPFGFMPFYPGPGLGGHCIPVDPTYLAWKMKSMNFEPRFIELATSINSRMPEYVVERVVALLNGRRRAVNGSRILVLGVAYKPDVNDVRESPSFDVIKLLSDLGARVRYHDPFVPGIVLAGTRMRSEPLTAASLRAADLVLILTAHRCVDYAAVVRHARLLFDTRNAAAGLSGRSVHRL